MVFSTSVRHWSRLRHGLTFIFVKPDASGHITLLCSALLYDSARARPKLAKLSGVSSVCINGPLLLHYIGLPILLQVNRLFTIQ